MQGPIKSETLWLTLVFGALLQKYHPKINEHNLILKIKTWSLNWYINYYNTPSNKKVIECWSWIIEKKIKISTKYWILNPSRPKTLDKTKTITKTTGKHWNSLFSPPFIVFICIFLIFQHFNILSHMFVNRFMTSLNGKLLKMLIVTYK